MTVVSDSSPLIALAKIDAFDLLQKLYGTLMISTEVYDEVVLSGAGLAGAGETSKSSWIEIRNIRSRAGLKAAQVRFGLGLGELSTMVLARVAPIWSSSMTLPLADSPKSKVSECKELSPF